MRVLVTGSSGHLGEALVRSLDRAGHGVVGIDVRPSRFTTCVASITDTDQVRRCMRGIEAVFHTATLHKPHLATHSRQAFVETNVSGTLTLLEASVREKVASFVYTSTTSVFGDALVPPPEAPAAWITEATVPIPKNIYGVTKATAEDLCRVFHRNHGLPSMVLRTSRFFPEVDDDRTVRETYPDANAKMNEYLFRRVDLEDVVAAHLLAADRAPRLGFGQYIISATTPFQPDDMRELRGNAPLVVERRVPSYVAEYRRRGWRMLRGIDRVYVNTLARTDLGWQPRYDFAVLIKRLRQGEEIKSPTAKLVGSKGYHVETFSDGPYPTARD